MFSKHFILHFFLILMFFILRLVPVFSQDTGLEPDLMFGRTTLNDTIIWDDSTEIDLFDVIPADPIFMPVIFDGKILPDHLQLYTPASLWKEPAYIPEQKPVALFERELYGLELQRQARSYLYSNSSGAIKYIKNKLPKDIPVAKEIKINEFRTISDLDKPIDFSSSGSPDIIRPKRRYWTATYETSMQFAQNYISENWYKGGESNFNLRTANKFIYNYEKDKMKLSSIVEYKLALYTTPTDTLRSYRIGEDAFSIISSYGYRAFSKWYYSLSMDFRTQFFNNYYENKMTKSSSLLSPMGLNLGLGMEYKLNKRFAKKHKSLDLSVNFSPFSFNMKYLLDDDVDKKRHGFLPDEDFIKSFGSKVIATMQFNFNRDISWGSKFYYFSNFERVEAEFENTLNLSINRYFSTKIYFDVRFDDSVKRADPSDSYLQYYEILSFGFNYKF